MELPSDVQKGSDSMMSERILNLNKEAMQYLRNDECDKALDTLQQAETLLSGEIKFASALEYARLTAVTFNNLGCTIKRLNKLHTSLSYLRKALKLELTTQTHPCEVAGTHLNICAIFSQLDRHDEAIHHALAGLKLMETFAASTASDSLTKETQTHTDTHTNTQTQTQTDVNMVTSPSVEVDTTTTLAIAYHNVAVEYEFLKDSQAALDMYNKGYIYASSSLGSDHAITKSLENGRKLASLALEASTPRGLKHVHSSPRRSMGKPKPSRPATARASSHSERPPPFDPSARASLPHIYGQQPHRMRARSAQRRTSISLSHGVKLSSERLPKDYALPPTLPAWPPVSATQEESTWYSMSPMNQQHPNHPRTSSVDSQPVKQPVTITDMIESVFTNQILHAGTKPTRPQTAPISGVNRHPVPPAGPRASSVQSVNVLNRLDQASSSQVQVESRQVFVSRTNELPASSVPVSSIFPHAPPKVPSLQYCTPSFRTARTFSATNSPSVVHTKKLMRPSSSPVKGSSQFVGDQGGHVFLPTVPAEGAQPHRLVSRRPTCRYQNKRVAACISDDEKEAAAEKEDRHEEEEEEDEEEDDGTPTAEGWDEFAYAGMSKGVSRALSTDHRSDPLIRLHRQRKQEGREVASPRRHRSAERSANSQKDLNSTASTAGVPSLSLSLVSLAPGLPIGDVSLHPPNEVTTPPGRRPSLVATGLATSVSKSPRIILEQSAEELEEEFVQFLTYRKQTGKDASSAHRSMIDSEVESRRNGGRLDSYIRSAETGDEITDQTVKDVLNRVNHIGNELDELSRKLSSGQLGDDLTRDVNPDIGELVDELICGACEPIIGCAVIPPNGACKGLGHAELGVEPRLSGSESATRFNHELTFVSSPSPVDIAIQQQLTQGYVNSMLNQIIGSTVQRCENSKREVAQSVILNIVSESIRLADHKSATLYSHDLLGFLADSAVSTVEFQKTFEAERVKQFCSDLVGSVANSAVMRVDTKVAQSMKSFLNQIIDDAVDEADQKQVLDMNHLVNELADAAVEQGEDRIIKQFVGELVLELAESATNQVEAEIAVREAVDLMIERVEISEIITDLVDEVVSESILELEQQRAECCASVIDSILNRVEVQVQERQELLTCVHKAVNHITTQALSRVIMKEECAALVEESIDSSVDSAQNRLGVLDAIESAMTRAVDSVETKATVAGVIDDLIFESTVVKAVKKPISRSGSSRSVASREGKENLPVPDPSGKRLLGRKNSVKGSMAKKALPKDVTVKANPSDSIFFSLPQTLPSTNEDFMWFVRETLTRAQDVMAVVEEAERTAQSVETQLAEMNIDDCVSLSSRMVPFTVLSPSKKQPSTCHFAAEMDVQVRASMLWAEHLLNTVEKGRNNVDGEVLTPSPFITRPANLERAVESTKKSFVVKKDAENLEPIQFDRIRNEAVHLVRKLRNADS